MADVDLLSIAESNLEAWKKSGTIRSVKVYTADDDVVCEQCRSHDGQIIEIGSGKIGMNLPPFLTCRSGHCRCYFRPEESLS